MIHSLSLFVLFRSRIVDEVCVCFAKGIAFFEFMQSFNTIFFILNRFRRTARDSQ